MKNTQPKRILIALVVGLALSLVSLFYFTQTTITSDMHEAQAIGAAVVSQTVHVTVHGFPFSAVVLERDGSIKYITTPLVIGNWMLYSILAFIGLQFWRPKLTCFSSSMRLLGYL